MGEAEGVWHMIVVDPEAVAQYCKVVWANPLPGAWVALRGLPEKPRKDDPCFIWIEADDSRGISKVVQFVEECSRRGLAAYCIPALVSGRGRAGAGDVVGMATLCVDFDTGDVAGNLARASQALGTPTMVVNSGGVTEEGQLKRHAYWRVTGKATVAELAALRGRLAAAYGGDPSFGSAHQPLRIAGSVHRKAEPKTVTIAYCNPANEQHVMQFEQRLPVASVAGHNNPPGIKPKWHAVPLEELIERVVAPGGVDVVRWQALGSIAGMLLTNINNLDDSDECARELENYRNWVRVHVVRAAADFDVDGTWRRLMARERSKRLARQSRGSPHGFRRPPVARSRSF